MVVMVFSQLYYYVFLDVGIVGYIRISEVHDHQAEWALPCRSSPAFLHHSTLKTLKSLISSYTATLCK